jgi:protein-S-isoprenylcysteine O-methyltransferase Ste14
MRPYQRLFGSGPLGLLASIALLALARAARPHLPPPGLGLSPETRIAALGIAIFLTGVLAAWSFRALPPEERGRVVCERGPYRYLRHPLYASFLSVFDLGLAVYLDHWIYLAWAVSLHPLWHWIVGHEERLMRGELGEAYAAYARRTGRFLPRWPVR